VIKYISDSAERTYQFGVKIGKLLKGNETIAFYGEIGAGKTTMIKGVCEGCGVKDFITSPTYTLVNEYKGDKFKVYHIDCYRENRIDEWIELGIFEYIASPGVVLIEWGDKIEGLLPDDVIKIRLESQFAQENKRIIMIKGNVEWLEPLSKMRYISENTGN